MITQNQIIRSLNNIADAHRQIKSFGNGSIQEFATSGTTNYMSMWVDYEPCVLNGKVFNQNFRIYIFDRLIKGKKNELEVFSDTQQVCLDIIAQLKSPIYGWTIVNDSVTLNPVSEPMQDDEIAGYYFDVDLKVPFNYDRCAIPFDSTITNESIEPNNLGGHIIVYLDGNLVQSITSTNLNNETVTIVWS